MNELSLNPPSNRFDQTVDRRARDEARDEREADRFEERLEEARKTDEAREEERRAKGHEEAASVAVQAPSAPRPLQTLGGNPGSGAASSPASATRAGGPWMTAFSQIAPLTTVGAPSSASAPENVAPPKADAKPASLTPKGGELAPSTKGEVQAETPKAKAVVKTEMAPDPRWLQTPEAALMKAKALDDVEGVRVHVDRDLAVEVAWQAEGLEVRVDGTVDAVDPMKELGSAMEDMLGRNGARLLDYSTHIRAAEEQEALKSENQTTDETHNDLVRRVLKGTLVNVVA